MTNLASLDELLVLVPFNRLEALTVAGAVTIAGKSSRTIREWCLRYGIGRKIGGEWAISKVALAMHLDGNWAALKAYHSGDRTSPLVTGFFERCGVPLQRLPFDRQEGALAERNRCFNA